ncbi:SIR2 family protein [Paenibacillus sp. tmac-D7]|uniref:SIR2 family protein n=1 Tax=Paenibacillus sp. tmac-D7 TaxID=2591462 RepID=UPI001141C3B3|nr:SIR2 family protein [Paenibacillus sp. tmac-D7]
MVVFQQNSILDKMKKYIESGNIHFLIGSGASIKAISTLGNLENDLTMYIRDYQNSKQEEIKHRITELINNFLEGVKEPNQNLIANLQNGDDVLKANVAATLDEYMDFLKTIYQLLLIRGSDRLPKKINVFTTNYDLFFEFALEKSKIPYNDGGIGVFHRYFGVKNFQKRTYKLSDSYSYQYEEPVINIVKLHGSVNWFFENDTDSIRILNKLSLPDISTEYLDEHAYFKQDLNLPIILPTKQKFVRTLMEHTYYDISRFYSNELEREQSVLFVFGFSFEDEHFRSITQRALGNPSLTMLIFPYSFGDEQKLLRYFYSFTNVKVVRIERDAIEQSEENDCTSREPRSSYNIMFAGNGMEEGKRINIDFEIFTNLFEYILNLVSESKVSL